MKQFEIKFDYEDEYTRGGKSHQSCILYADSDSEAIMECIKIYGLTECIWYEITSVTEVR